MPVFSDVCRVRWYLDVVGYFYGVGGRRSGDPLRGLLGGVWRGMLGGRWMRKGIRGRGRGLEGGEGECLDARDC